VLVLGGPSLAGASLPADLEQSLVLAPAAFAEPGARDASDARLPAGAFCPPRRSDSTAVFAQAAGFATFAGLAGLFARRRAARA